MHHQSITLLENYGFLGTIFIYPMSWSLFFLSILFDNNVGLAIIILTIMVRLLLLPLVIKQRKTFLKLDDWRADKRKLDKKYENISSVEMRKEKAREINAISQKHDFKPYTAGCLPFIIQGIVLISLFQSIRRETQFYEQEFLWFSLSGSDPFIIVNILVFLSIFIQAKVTSPKYVKFRYILSVLLFLFSLLLPSAILIYLIVSNVFVTIQHLILSKIYIRKEVVSYE